MGLAACQLGVLLGAEVYAAAGSDEKLQKVAQVVGLPKERLINYGKVLSLSVSLPSSAYCPSQCTELEVNETDSIRTDRRETDRCRLRRCIVCLMNSSDILSHSHRFARSNPLFDTFSRLAAMCSINAYAAWLRTDAFSSLALPVAVYLLCPRILPW
jgi:hypothetical protein